MTQTQSIDAQVAQLAAALPALTPRDRDFAGSLISDHRRRRLTPRQAPWVGRLLERARATDKAPAEKIDPGGLAALFSTAGRLQHPALHVCLAGAHCKISRAGRQSRTPGAFMIAEDGGFGGLFYGRIMPDGAWMPGRDFRPEVLAALRAFAADPVPALVEQGRVTGRCCFCGLQLTDARSIAAGYGPVCAGNWGLPWGAERVA